MGVLRNNCPSFKAKCEDCLFFGTSIIKKGNISCCIQGRLKRKGSAMKDISVSKDGLNVVLKVEFFFVLESMKPSF